MEPALTWRDPTARDRDKMRRVLNLFSEQSAVDEMGLGSIRMDLLFMTREHRETHALMRDEIARQFPESTARES